MMVGQRSIGASLFGCDGEVGGCVLALVLIKITWVEILSWRVSILKDPGMSQTQYAVCIKRQSQSQLIVRSAVITSVMSVLLCGQEIGVSHNATTQ